MQREGSAAARRAAVLGVCLGLMACRGPEGAPQVLDPAPLAADFSAEGADGQPFRMGAQRGRLVLLSFGYTSCPDVCPTTLSRLRSMYRQLGTGAQDVAVVFLTVDPERDTPERLRSYLAAFEPRFQGAVLHGEALHQTLERYGITAVKRVADARRYRNLAGASGEPPYSIDHTGGYLVIDRAGALRLRYPHAATAEQLASGVRELLGEGA
jgi:protein SCO1